MTDLKRLQELVRTRREYLTQADLDEIIDGCAALLVRNVEEIAREGVQRTRALNAEAEVNDLLTEIAQLRSAMPLHNLTLLDRAQEWERKANDALTEVERLQKREIDLLRTLELSVIQRGPLEDQIAAVRALPQVEPTPERLRNHWTAYRMGTKDQRAATLAALDTIGGES
jgi:hypothetical protein